VDRYRERYGGGAIGGHGETTRPASMPRRRPAAPISTAGPSDFDVMPDYENSGDTPRGYEKGMRVRHPTFGVGSIYQVEGQGEMQKVSVVFSDQTFKKFVVKYARLEVIS
jgi:DNA helicase-2/ATP-dependent DNA helicase PcrA